MITSEKIDLIAEKRLVIGLATNAEFCDAFLDIDTHLFDQDSYRVIAKQCLQYYTKYGIPIGQNLYATLMSAYRRNSPLEKDSILEKMEKLLFELSREANNSKFTKAETKARIDDAYKYLNWRFNQKLQEKLRQSDDDVEARELIEAMRPPQKQEGDMFSWTEDAKTLSHLLSDEEGGERLFTFPDKLGEIVGEIRRQDFICFAGFYKSGKTHSLCYAAQTAIVEGLNVLFVSLEMSAKEIAERLTAWIEHKPIAIYGDEDKEKIERPYFERTVTGREVKAEIRYKSILRKAFDRKEEDLKQKAIIGYSRLLPTKGKSGLVAIPRGTLSVSGLKRLCVQFRGKYGVKPDVVVLDYADLMKQFKKDDLRTSLGDIWEGLRSLAQQEDFALITASQLNGDGKSAMVSDDRRKYAVVTSMVKLYREKGWLEKGCLGVQQEMIRRGKPNKRELILLHNYGCGEVVIDQEWLSNIPELHTTSEEKRKNDKKCVSLDAPAAKTAADGTFTGSKNESKQLAKRTKAVCMYPDFDQNGEHVECRMCMDKPNCLTR